MHDPVEDAAGHLLGYESNQLVDLVAAVDLFCQIKLYGAWGTGFHPRPERPSEKVRNDIIASQRCE